MSRLPVVLLLLLLAVTPFRALANETVDINTADAAELARVLVGVGRARAEGIVEHREKFGPFTSIDELRYVNGIGAATIERNRDRITVGAAPPPAATAARNP